MKFKRFELALLIITAAVVLFTAGFLIGRNTGRVRIHVTGSAAPTESPPLRENPAAFDPLRLHTAGGTLLLTWSSSPGQAQY